MYAEHLKRFNTFPNLSKMCWLLLMFSFLEASAGGISYYLSLYLGSSTNFNKLEIGQIGFSMGLGSLLGGLIAALVTDRLGAKSIISASFIIASLAFYFIPISNNFYLVSFCALLMGISSNTFITANNTLLLQSAPQEESILRTVQSMKTVTENIGNSASIALIMFFAAQNYGGIFQGIGIMFFLFAISAIKLLAVVKNPMEVANSIKADLKINRFNKRKFYLSISSVFLIGLIFAQQRTAYPLFLHDTFDSYKITAFLFWIDPVIVALFQVKITSFFAKYRPTRVMGFGALLLGSGLLLLMYVDSFFGAMLSCLVFICGEMLFMPTSSVLCFESAGNKKQGFSVGAWRTAYSSGLMIGPLVSGLLLHYYNYNYCWMFAGAVSILIFLILLIEERKLLS